MDLLPIFGAAVLNMLIGFLWYSPMLFSKPWMKAMGFKKEDIDEAKKKDMNMKYAMMFVASLILAWVMQMFIMMLGAHTFSDGMKLGFFIWLGFTATAQFGHWIFSGKPKELFYIDTTYHLVGYTLMGGLLAVWR